MNTSTRSRVKLNVAMGMAVFTLLAVGTPLAALYLVDATSLSMPVKASYIVVATVLGAVSGLIALVSVATSSISLWEGSY